MDSRLPTTTPDLHHHHHQQRQQQDDRRGRARTPSMAPIQCPFPGAGPEQQPATIPPPASFPREESSNHPGATQYEETLRATSPRTMSPQGHFWGRSHSRQPTARCSRSSDDIIIAVMGKTGSGKSSFISSLAVRDYSHAIGHGLASKTQEVVEVECIVDGRRVVMVDTPGFDDTNMTDGTVLNLLVEWLSCSYEAGARLSGIIFLQDILDTSRAAKSTIKNLNLFNKLTGNDSMTNVVIVTSKWDVLDNNPHEIQRAVERERRFCEVHGLWKKMLEDGAKVMRHSCTRQSAREIVKTILSLLPTVLLVQKQVHDGAAVIDTDVGRYVNEEYLRMQAEHKNEMDEMREEMKEAKQKGRQGSSCAGGTGLQGATTENDGPKTRRDRTPARGYRKGSLHGLTQPPRKPRGLRRRRTRRPKSGPLSLRS
ncbi:P-loop containing nucleoside triphosphate hydrolase protein [Naviculisporaceae sp. PSN 640]